MRLTAPKGKMVARGRSRTNSAAIQRLSRINHTNQKLAASIDFSAIIAHQEPLVIGENGVVQNYNPQNPAHKKWTED